MLIKSLLGLTLGVLTFQQDRPQAFVDKARQHAVIATYSDQTIRIAKTAPADLTICFGEVCRTHAEWKIR